MPSHQHFTATSKQGSLKGASDEQHRLQAKQGGTCYQNALLHSIIMSPVYTMGIDKLAKQIHALLQIPPGALEGLSVGLRLII